MRERLQVAERRRRQLHARGRRLQPVEVRVERERAPVVHAQRLEDGASAQHALVVGAQHRLVRRDDAASELRECEQAHASSVCAAWRSQVTPSSRSSTGIRSSAEWMSVDITSGGIRAGKKP